MRLPCLARLAVVDGVDCLLVDGRYVRDRIDVEFTNGAHHGTRRYVPENEVWVDREAPGAEELELFVEHQLDERALMRAGFDYHAALRRASRRERLLRLEAMRRRGEELLVGDAARERVRREVIGRAAGCTVWLVDGRAVRDHFTVDFTLGGHGLRYRFIPRREIWIDDAAHVRERDAVLLHEVTELELMRGGMRYHDAHRRASAAERRLRQSGARRSVGERERREAA